MTTNFMLSPAPPLDIASKTQAPEKVREAEESKTAKTDEEKKNAQADVKRFDTFEKSEETASSNPSGIYRVEEDENGGLKISFEKPIKTDRGAGQDAKAQDAEKADEAQEPEIMRCTVNTDQVDAEIKNLQQKKQEIARQIKGEENPDKRRKLEEQLATIGSQLQAKDNDGYRKQHASFTYG